MDRKGMSHADAGKLGAKVSAHKVRQAKLKRVAEYDANPKRCPVCGDPIPYDKKSEYTYCSRSCAAKVNNSNYPKRKPKATSMEGAMAETQISKICPVCKRQHNAIRSIYCSAECAANRRYAEYVRSIEDTGMVPTDRNGEAKRKIIKRYLIEKLGHKCAICGINEWCNQPAPLVVDHIDGDASNNKISNFRLVCGNCDMQLPTYKSKNKSKRIWRTRYYNIVGSTALNPSRFVKLRCLQCGKEFVRAARYINLADSDRFYSCSRSCSVKWSHTMRRSGFSECELSEFRKQNILEFFDN